MSATPWRPPSQAGRTILVTGTGGLGLEAALALADAGARVILAGRSAEKGAAAVAQIAAAAPTGHAEFEPVDLGDLKSIAALAARLEARGDAIDVLINNAGVMSPPKRRTTADGFEQQFGVNYLGHFALTGRLLPLLRRSPAGRVVNVTSLAHRYGPINFDDLQSARAYRAGVAYCQSKLAQAIFSIELQRRSDENGWGLKSLAAHPGFAGTDLFANGPGASSVMGLVSRVFIAPLFGQSAEAGSQPLVYAAAAPQVTGGALYGPTGPMEMKGPPGERGFAKTAKDPDVATRLWRVSEELAQVRFG